jgi:hypothetical protein
VLVPGSVKPPTTAGSVSRAASRPGVDRVALLVSLGVASVVLGPMLWRRGFVLRGDMVFVPDQPWKAAWLGLDGRVPRFVPGDAFVSAAGALLPGDLVQKGVLLLAFVVAGSGVGRMIASYGGVARAGAITLYLWNPWVYERLAIGQWGVVVGYALLPWCVLAAERLRARNLRAWCALVGWLGLAAVFSPASWLVALVVVVAVLLGRREGRLLPGAFGVGLTVNFPWILPSLLITSGMSAASGQFSLFGPRAESGWGVAGSVLSLGGIWKAGAVPGERGNNIVVALSLLLTVVALLGLLRARRREPARVAGLGLAGLAAVVVALLTAVPGVPSALDHLAASVPAVGLVRDSDRYLGPVALVLAVGIAGAVDWLWARARPGREALRAVAVLVVLAPVLALPSLAWGLRGQWHPVYYPAEWYAVRNQLPEGRTVVLPWAGAYRGFAWNHRHAGLDPAPRFFPGDVLVDDRMLVGRRVLASEDPVLRAVRRALDSGDPAASLRRLGVRNVLLEKGNGAALPKLAGSAVLHDGRGLTLVSLGPTRSKGEAEEPETWRRAVVVVVDIAALLGWVAAVVIAAARRSGSDADGV